MASDFAAQLKEEARPFLEDGEEIIASFVAQPRGTTNSKVGGLAPQAIGGAWAGKSKKGAEAAGLKLANPMALALSDRRLIVFGIETSAMGKPKAVKELVSSVPVGEVESIQVKRLLVGKTVKVSANAIGFDNVRPAVSAPFFDLPAHAPPIAPGARPPTFEVVVPRGCATIEAMISSPSSRNGRASSFSCTAKSDANVISSSCNCRQQWRL